METLDPNNDAENRHAVGGRKRSNRRSSILKTAKSPMKIALEDIDPNSIGTGKENREKKTRRSSSRRVSFAETNQIKEFCKDEEWHTLWERENASKFTDQQIEHSDKSPSEYRQPTDTIKGLESLLKGNIQNTEQELEDQVEPSMDFTFCGGNINEQSSRQPLTSLNSYNQYQDEEQINALELTCHGQGLIEQDVDAIAGCNAFQYYDQALGCQKNLQYYKAQEEREQSVRIPCNKENETMDFTVCHRGRFEAQVSSHTMTGNNRTIVFDANSGDDLDSLELTCYGQGLIKQTRVCQSTDTHKINPSSFLQSLGRRPSSQAKETPDHSQPLSLEQLQQKENMAAKVNPKSFLSSLGKSKVQVSKESIPNTYMFDKQKASIAASYSLEKTSQCIHGNTEVIDSPEPEEDMEMTTCLDVEAANTNFIENPPISEEAMDMTTCVPPASRLQDHSPAMSDGQMDVTTCVSPASRLQDHSSATSDGQMDMTTCVPPASRLQDHSSATSDGQMDMTTCVPPALRLQDHSSTTSDGQMDMTTCVPPALRLQNHSPATSDGQMDMTTCVPPASRLQDHSSATSDGQMDMTTCVPPALRLQDHSSTTSDGQMDMTTCVPPALRLQNHSPATSDGQMDMTTCVPPASRLQDHSSATSDGQMDMTTCVPPALRLQDHSSTTSDGQMDMTTCVPPALRLQNHSPATSDGQMDMTTCVPPASRLQDHSLAMLDGQMDMTTCVPPVPSSIFVEDEYHIMNKRKEKEPEGMDMTAPIGNTQDSSKHDDGSATSGYNVYVADGMDVTKCQMQSQEPSLKCQTDNRKRQNSSSIDSSLYSEEPSEKKKQVENQQDQEQRANDPDTSYTGPISLDMHSSFNKKLGSSKWLNCTMPILGQQKTQAKFLKSLPALSKSLMESDGPANKNIPHATFAPISNVPISRFCSQSAMKRKMIQIDNQEIPVLQEDIQGLSLPKPKSENEGPASSSVVGQEDDKPTDSCQPPGGEKILKSCHSGAYQDALEDDDDAVITFKDPIRSMPELLSSENQMEEHSTVTGLMEEPTLEMDFTDQSTISVESNVIHGASLQEGQGKIPSPNNESISQIENQGQSQCAAKQQARNLSTICEENCEENESDCSKAAHHAAAADKGVAFTKRNNMTVAELLSRANISFHNMEQVSRRSTIAFMKKAEKPKEDKEFLQLSLVTKPQALHYGDICTDIQKQLEQLKGRTEQMEVELNQSNASIFQHTDDSEIPKLETTLKDLKNICKKCARRKWIRRTAAMKRKLAFMLKENYEILSSDVHNIDETLLVTNDCIKLIDGIDNEMEKGIEDLRKTIEDSEKGNKELDEVEALLHQKKTELESREAELKHVESQRSSLVNIKETLSSEKETLEREQLEHDEILSNLKNKASASETNETLSDQYKWLEGCLEWELTEWSQTHAKFLFLYNTLALRVDFHPSVARSCPSQPTIKKIQNISLSSQLADDSHLSARFVHSLVVNGLERELLQKSNSNTAVLPKVLDHVTGLVIAARSLGNELFEMNFQYILTMKDNSVYVEFSSVKAFMKFIVQFTINVCKFPDEVEITVIPKIGKCCVQDIQDALTAVPTGPKYMSRLVDTARQFLDKK